MAHRRRQPRSQDPTDPACQLAEAHGRVAAVIGLLRAPDTSRTADQRARWAELIESPHGRRGLATILQAAERQLDAAHAELTDGRYLNRQRQAELDALLEVVS